MKHNIYDLFSEYTGELPEIKKDTYDAERIKQLVSQKIKQSDTLENTVSHNSELCREAEERKRKTHFLKPKKRCEFSQTGMEMRNTVIMNTSSKELMV